MEYTGEVMKKFIDYCHFLSSLLHYVRYKNSSLHLLWLIVAFNLHLWIYMWCVCICIKYITYFYRKYSFKNFHILTFHFIASKVIMEIVRWFCIVKWIDAKRFIATFTFDKNLFELKGKFVVRTSPSINFLTPRLNFLTKSVHQKCVYNMLRQVWQIKLILIHIKSISSSTSRNFS